MLDSGVSPASIARAVNRRGERWGLSAAVKPDGRVKVCDVVYDAEVRGGIGVVRRVPRDLCTVDDEHPFSGALANRVTNGETDMGRRYDLADRREKDGMERRFAEYDAETRRQWISRKRATFGPGFFSPAGLVERAAHRRRIP